MISNSTAERTTVPTFEEELFAILENMGINREDIQEYEFVDLRAATIKVVMRDGNVHWV